MRLIGFVKEFFVLFLLLFTFASSIPGKVCNGDKVDSKNNGSFKNCTEIDGHLNIENVTFTGDKEISKMDPGKLEVFSTNKDSTGVLNGTASHSDFTDLCYFRSLQMIGEMEYQSDVHIVGTSAESVGLRSLKRTSVRISWHESLNNSDIRVEDNRHKDACLADNMVCHEKCSKDVCWGPGVDECLSCNGFSPEGTCLESCSYPGVYRSGDKTCAKCHERCRKCTGYGFSVSVCDECVKFRSEEKCEDQCPIDYYTDYHTMRCIRCSSDCKGCRGPGSDQCESCRNLKVPLGDDITHEFNCSDTCPEDKPHIRLDKGRPYCSVKDPVEETNMPDIVGGVVACIFVIGISAAAYCYQCWQRTCLRENTVKMTMGMVGQEESDPLKTADVEPNSERLSIFKDDELCSKNILLGYRALGDHHPVCAADEQVDKAKGPIVNLKEPFNEEGIFMPSPVFHLYEFVFSNDLTADRPQGNSGGDPKPQFTAAKLPVGQWVDSVVWSISEYLANEDWIGVGRNLKMANNQLEELKSTCQQKYRECAHQMLLSWRQSNPKCTLRDLFDALKQLGKELTIEQIKSIDFSKHMTQK